MVSLDENYNFGVEMKKLTKLEEKVIETLGINSSKHKTDYVWMDTREIANASEINIYTSRYILLKLKKKGLVLQEVVKGKPYLWSLKLKERAF